jgi:Asp-tRNA(Asn)/Glu-tRNA(Gln) amidotransferase C subunit
MKIDTKLVEKLENLAMLEVEDKEKMAEDLACLLYTSPSPRDGLLSRMPSSA